MKSKNFELGEWIFEINSYDVDKATVLLPELVCIFSKPISDVSEKIKDIDPTSNVLSHASKFFESLDLLFTGYLKPSEVPNFLKNVLAEVRCKKKSLGGSFVDLLPVYKEVFTGNLLNQFVLAKEVLFFNFEQEFQRFFGSLLGFTGTTEEVKASQTTLTQPVKIKAR